MGGIAHYRHVADGVCGGGEIVAHGPETQGGDVEELDEPAGLFAPAGEEAVEHVVCGGQDPFLAFPLRVLEINDDYVEDFAVIDGVAEDGFAWKGVSGVMGESGDLRSRRTGSAKEHGILRVFRAQFGNRLFHWDKSSVSDRARTDRMNRHVGFSKKKFPCGAMDAVGAHDCICRCSGAVLEVESYFAAFFGLN